MTRPVAALALRAIPRIHTARRSFAVHSSSASSARRAPRPSTPPVAHNHWSATHFGLERTRAFKEASPEQQREILERCGAALLEEGFVFEKTGLTYAAKMVLLSDSVSEQQLYAMISAEEAAHVERLAPFYHADRETSWEDNALLALLEGLISEGDRASLQLVLQVVIEGWAVWRYRAMRDDCETVQLRTSLNEILRDEATHHASGVAFLREGQMSARSERLAIEALLRIMHNVRLGPVEVVTAVETATGGLTRAQHEELLTQLGSESHVRVRLDLIEGLLSKAPAAKAVLTALQGRSAFMPYRLHEIG